jgi:hypothetical protein
MGVAYAAPEPASNDRDGTVTPMRDWWVRNIVEPGKLPIFLCFAAFVVTFLATRTITRLIRAGRGPFKNNVSSSGVHVHHAVPGIILLIIGAFIAVGVPANSPWPELAAVAIGIGTSLVLDEFALILHLEDVYWSDEGRLSVEMVTLAMACLGLLLIGVLPFGVDDQSDGEVSARVSAMSVLAVNMACVVLCVLKGKRKLALFGIFLAPFAYIGAIRLARPGSAWARRRYGREPRRLERATRRAERFDARWDPVADRVSNLIAGRPSEPDPS